MASQNPESSIPRLRLMLVRTFPQLRTIKRLTYRTLDRLDHLSGAWLLRRTVQRQRLIHDLHRLNDVLARTPLAGRYWLHGGVLLGWARDGKLLLNDPRDVDLGYRAEDRSLFEAAIPSLVAAGFRRTHAYRTLDGRAAIDRFERRRIWHEFFAMWQANDGLHAYSFGYETPGTEDAFVENVHEYPDDELVPFSFLGRTWLKPANHEAFLDANYGNWRIDNPGFIYLNSPSIIEHHQCPSRDTVEERIEA